MCTSSAKNREYGKMILFSQDASLERHTKNGDVIFEDCDLQIKISDCFQKQVWIKKKKKNQSIIRNDLHF